MTRKRTLAAEAIKPTTKTTAKVTEPAKTPTRNDLLARLVELGYDGPTSYTASVLRDELLPWVESGCPADGKAPTGAMNHVHPTAKPERVVRRSKAYFAAVADLRASIVDGKLTTVKAITAHLDALLAEQETDAA